MPLNKFCLFLVTVLIGTIDPDYQEEIGLLLHNRGKGRLCLEGRRSFWISVSATMPWFKSMENYDNQIQAGLPIAKTLQE